MINNKVRRETELKPRYEKTGLEFPIPLDWSHHRSLIWKSLSKHLGGLCGFFFPHWFIFIFLLYNIVLVLPYINVSLPRVYTCSASWTPLPPPSPYHPSESSQYTSPKHPVSCIEPGLVLCGIFICLISLFLDNGTIILSSWGLRILGLPLTLVILLIAYI